MIRAEIVAALRRSPRIADATLAEYRRWADRHPTGYTGVMVAALLREIAYLTRALARARRGAP
jgi:hypothetical protein